MKSNIKYPSFPHVNHEHMQTLMKCYSICSSCSKMCIEENMPETAILCGECADICGLAIKLHSADSPFNTEMMQLCSDVCEKCADACGKMNNDHCQQCAEICHECADACKNAIQDALK